MSEKKYPRKELSIDSIRIDGDTQPREKIDTGAFQTSFMKFGDSVEIEMRDAAGQSIFGAIRQRVTKAVKAS